MILIADSGSTKTDWAFVDRGTIFYKVKTQGINPFHQSEEVMTRVLCEELLPQVSGVCRSPEAVFFYGSGVRDEMKPMMRGLLAGVFPEARLIEAHSDLTGAARALCGDSPGIACILGTGANSCLYDGRDIVMNTPALGYILGDEGSGAVLGVRFLNALYKGVLPVTVRDAFGMASGETMASVIRKVYREPMANRFLASLAPFIHSQLHVPEVERLVVDNFRDFLVRNVAPYFTGGAETRSRAAGRESCGYPVSAVGSIAWHFRQQFLRALALESMPAGTILQSPLDGLAGRQSCVVG